MRKRKYLLSAFLIAVTFTVFCISGCGSSNAKSANTAKKDTTDVSEKETEETTGESIITDTDEPSNEATDTAEIATTQTDDNTAKDVASDNSSKTATSKPKSNGDTAKTTTKKNDAKATTPAKQTNASAGTNSHTHTWNPVYATRTVKEVWTEEVTEEYTAYEVHYFNNGHSQKEGIGYDLTYQYNDYIENERWKNETPNDMCPDTTSVAFFINCAQWVPDYIGDFSEWVKGSGSDYDNAGMAFPTHDIAARMMRSSYHTEDIPVTKTRTYTVNHPAETENYLDHYACSCGATK